MRRCLRILNDSLRSSPTGDPFPRGRLKASYSTVAFASQKPVTRPGTIRKLDERREKLREHQVNAFNRYKIIDDHRQIFTTALETLVMMTPSDMPISRRAYTDIDKLSKELEYVPLPRTRRTRPQDYTGGSLVRHIHKITRPSSVLSETVIRELEDLFDNPHNRAILSVQAYTVAMSYAVRTHNFRVLRHFMRHGRQRGMTPDTNICNTVLALFVNEKDLLSWASAIREFAEVGTKADADTWNQLLTLSNSEEKLAVLRYMESANVQGNSVTTGIFLPIRRASFPSTEAFLNSLDFSEWTFYLGDVLIGELLRTQDISHVFELLKNVRFKYSIQGVEQILSHMYSIGTNRFIHLKGTRSVCAAFTRRRINPRPRTWYLLFKLGRRIRKSAYSNMIFRHATELGAVNAWLHHARLAQQIRRSEAGLKNADILAWDWHEWVQSQNLAGKTSLLESDVAERRPQEGSRVS